MSIVIAAGVLAAIYQFLKGATTTGGQPQARAVDTSGLPFPPAPAPYAGPSTTAGLQGTGTPEASARLAPPSRGIPLAVVSSSMLRGSIVTPGALYYGMLPTGTPDTRLAITPEEQARANAENPFVYDGIRTSENLSGLSGLALRRELE